MLNSKAGQVVNFSRRALLMGAASAVATASGLPQLDRSRADQPRKGGHLRVGVAAGQTTDSLDPTILDNLFTTALSYATNNYLGEIAADGTVQPELAESWSSTPDAKQWVYKLRKGVTFQNGKELTAEDVVASINHHRGPETKSAAKSVLKPVIDMKVSGKYEVIFVLDGGNADFPYIVSDFHLPILPSKDSKIEWGPGLGAGGYKIKTFEPGVRAELQRNPDYWKTDRAHFDSVELLAILDASARTTAMTTGDVEVVHRPDLKALTKLAAVPGIVIEETTGAQHYTFPMQMDVPPFDNNDVRTALKLAIDREDLVRKILLGHGSVGNDHPISKSNPYFASSIPQRTYDPEQAKSILQKAGLSNLKIDLSVADAAYSGAVDAGLLFREEALKAGIDINVVQEPNDGYWTNIWLKKPFVAAYWNGRPTADWMLTTTHTAGGAWNDTHFTDEHFQKLLREARAELDDAKRRNMYAEMQLIIRDEGGTIVPMFANYVWARSAKLAHAGTLAANQDLDGVRFIERWWFA